jgi:CRP-like cAMP-binding protein
MRSFPRGQKSALSLEEVIRQSAWGSSLSDDVVLRVADATERRHVAAGAFVVRAGVRASHWIGLLEGFVKMSITSRDGRLSTLSGLASGAWFGEGTLMKAEERRYDVLALRDSTLAFVPAETFEWLRQTSIPFNHYLQRLMNARMSLFIGLLEHDRLLDVESRVAHALASLIDPDLYPFASDVVQLNQDEVGLLANVSRQRANVALQTLQEAGLITLERGGLRILDLGRLRAFAAS